MAEWSNNALQTIEAGQNILFNENPVPCNMGFIYHRDGSGVFVLRGFVPFSSCRCRNREAQYLVTVGLNAALPEGATVEPIELAIAINGESLPASSMIYTPTAVEEFGNLNATCYVNIPRGCCETIAIENIGSQAVEVQNVNLVISRPDMYVVR